MLVQMMSRMLLDKYVRCTPMTGSPQLKTMSVVMSKSWLAMRLAQVGKSGDARTCTAMPTFFSWLRRYSATFFPWTSLPGM
ncbi:hypothetical protein D3C77_772170 [compost metagenome]